MSSASKYFRFLFAASKSKLQVVGNARCISQCTQHVVSSSYTEQSIPTQNLTEYVMKDWNKYGDKQALVCSETGKSYTYSQLTDAVRRLASNLTKLGIKDGDVIFLLSPNLPEYAVIYLASISIGAIVTTNNPMYTANEIAHAVKLGGCKLMITTPAFLPTVNQALDSLKEENPVKETIVIGNESGYRSLDSLLTRELSSSSPPDLDWEHHLACLPFSSGTTGLPKAVMLSHNNILSNIIQLNNCGFAVCYDDTLAGILPFFHIYGQVASMLVGLNNGSTIVTMPKFEFPKFLQAIQDHKITIAHLVPPIILGMTKSDLTNDYDLSSLYLISSGAAPLKTATSLEFRDKFKHTELLQGYGLTETSPVVTFNTRERNKHGSVGILLPNVKAKVVDPETEKSLESDKEGELYFYGPNIMKGYWMNQSASDDCLDGQWFRTGDIGYYDKEGHFFVVDRLKELIKYKGFQVAPAELEALLIAHPKIIDAAVVGIPSEEVGELPRAYVVVRPGESVSDQEIHDYIKANAANHKQLRGGIRQVKEVPKSASGKILRRLLKQEALKDM